MLPGWFKEPKLSGLNTLGELLWEGGLNFRGLSVMFGWPRVDTTCVVGILERRRGGVTIPQLVKLVRREAGRGGSRFDRGGVASPEKEVCDASSCWLEPRSRVPGGLRGFSGLSGGLLPSPSSSLLLPSNSCSSTSRPSLLRAPSLHLSSSLTLLPDRSPPDLPVTCSSASWGK